MNRKKYFDTRSSQLVELIECNEEKRTLTLRPMGEKIAFVLEFQEGFSPKNYLDKYFIESLE